MGNDKIESTKKKEKKKKNVSFFSLYSVEPCFYFRLGKSNWQMKMKETLNLN